MSREDPLARAERITAELRVATAEAAGVLKDLHAVIKAARTMADQYAAHEVSRVMNEHLRRCQSLADTWYADMVQDHNTTMDKLTDAQQNLLDRLGKGFELSFVPPDSDPDAQIVTHTGWLRPKD